MGKSSKKYFTVRGFDAFMRDQNGDRTPFNSLGVIENFPTYREKIVRKQHEAVVEMVSMPLSFTARNLIAAQAQNVPDFPKITDTRSDPTADAPEVIILDLYADTALDDLKVLSSYRKDVIETFKRWAEKSRVRGQRGWRLSAVKTPSFEKNPKTGTYTMKTQVILGTVVLYDNTAAKICVDSQLDADLTNLKRHLNKVTGGAVTDLRFVHSDGLRGSV